MTGWDDFLHWAERLVAEVDLDDLERVYKLTAAEVMRDALQACASNAQDWSTQLKKATRAGNFVNQYAQMWLGNKITERPDAIRQAFADLGGNGIEGLDQFSDRLYEIDPAVTPGRVTNLASVALMGLAPQEYPPYKAQFAANWAARVGEDVPRDPAGRYGTFLKMCDRVLALWGERNPRLRDRLDAQSLAWTVMNYPVFRWPPVEQSAILGWRSGASGEVPRGEGVAPVMERAVWKLLGPGLRGEPSVLLPGVVTWRKEAAEEISARLAKNPPGGGSFMDKLRQQFTEAPAEVMALLAELLYIRNAPLDDMTARTKVDRANQVLSWSPQLGPLPDDLSGVFEEQGAFRGGQGYHSRTAQHLQWMARFVEHWLDLTDTERAEALEDPFAFREVTASTEDDVPTIRYALEYLAWPGWFSSIVSADHRTRIHRHLMGDLGEASGTDDRSITRDLVALRKLHESEQGGAGQHWYQSPYIERWKDPSSAAPRAWHVRVGEAGKQLASQWFEGSFVSLSASRLGEISSGASLSEVRQVVRSGYSHLDRAQQEATSRAYWDFLTRIHRW